MTDQKRIGLLGGTFDPIHNGHIQLAQAAGAECDLDEVVFIPAAAPPHKDSTGISPFFHRVAMLDLVCESVAGLCLSTIENELPHPSYTITTLKALEKMRGSESKFFFIIGSDSFFEVQTWHRYQEILSRYSLIVARRNDHSMQTIAKQCMRLGYRQKPPDGRWGLGRGTPGEVLVINAIPINCSATEIKKHLREGRVLRQCLTEKVAAYIINHKLYQSRLSGGTDRHS